MPIVINEIVIKTNVETATALSDKTQNADKDHASIDEIVKQSVEKVLEILEEKKQR